MNECDKNASSDTTDEEKVKAMQRLMRELNEGRCSGEEQGYVSEDEVRAYLHNKFL